MNDLTSTHSAGDDATIASRERKSSLQQLAKKLRFAWSQNHDSNLTSYLKQHPELCRDNSLVIGLAVDEYRLRRDRGQSSNITQYCKPFADFGKALYSSVLRQIEVERYLDDHLDLRQIEGQTVWPSVGDQIAGYCVLDELGRGALARVYLCSQSALGDRQVVVKVSFHGVQEGRTLGKLQHPHIMPIHSVETAEDSELSYLCTPFLGRSTLHDLISIAFAEGIPTSSKVIIQASGHQHTPFDRVTEGPPSSTASPNRAYVDGILLLAIKLCDALAYAHSSGVVHGDLKPSNILLTLEGEPVLLDFNLARDDELALDVRGGTLPYMAPEQIAQLKFAEVQEPLCCDEKSEVFTLGVVLYELFSGQLPFDVDRESEDYSSVPNQILELQRQGSIALSILNPRVGSVIASKIERCLDIDRDFRFASMADLRVALQQELTPTRRFFRWSKIHRSLVATILLCVSLLSLSAGYWLANRPPFPVRQYQSGLAYRSTGKLDQALEAFERAVVASPDFVDGKFAIARTNLALGNINIALEQFTQLATVYENQASMAYVGYCYNLLKPHSLAIPWYERAIEAGFESVGVHNNLAFSYELDDTAKTTPERVQSAEFHFKRALQMAPKSTVVHYNCAHFEWLRFLNNPKYVPTQGLNHIHVLIKKRSGGSEVYTTATYLYAAVAQTNPAVLDDILDMLFDACKRDIGIDVEQICGGPLQQVIRDHPRFHELQQLASEKEKKVPGLGIARLLDPMIAPLSTEN